MADRAKSKKVNPITAYFRETTGELRKVSWPTRREAVQLTVLVIVTMVVVGIILFVADIGANRLLGLFLG